MKTASDEIEKLVNSWISAKPQVRNLSELARSLKVSRAALRRALTGESEMTFSMAGLILAKVANLESTIEILKTGWEKEFKAFSGFLNYKAMKANFNSAQENQVFESITPLGFAIYCAAFEGDGISLSDVEKEFGQIGVSVLERLAEGNLLELNGRYYQGVPWHMPRLDTQLQVSNALLGLISEHPHFFSRFNVQIRTGLFDKKKIDKLNVLESKYMQALDELIEEAPQDSPVNCTFSWVSAVPKQLIRRKDSLS